ncbi:hypothetical protein EU77_11805 [Mesotoga sp. SC_NapDC]|nr:hypothetical protein EU77_11805 [Mesotoga sp. SC_NapDC]
MGWKEQNKTQGWEEQPRTQCCLRWDVCTEEHQWTQAPLRGEAFDGSTLSLAAISGFSAFKRAAAFSVNGFMILNGQR